MARIGIDARMYSSAFTGIGRYVAELVRGLARLDRTNEYVIFLNPAEYKIFRAPGKNFRAVRVSARHYSLAEQTSFLAALWRERLDLMHFTHFNAPLFYSRPSVVTIHDLTLSYFPGKKMTSFLERVAYNLVVRRSVNHARKIISVSENTKKDLVKLLDIAPQKIRTIYNGLGTEFRPTKNLKKIKTELARKYGIHSDYLLYTGVWRDHKNILGLIRAFAMLRREHCFSGRLVLTGRPDPVYAPEVRRIIAECNLQKAVILPGLVPEKDLRALYQAARVFVFPSFYEGFGFPPLEAMAAGVPVAASSTSSIPEVCGNAAVFFDPRDHEEMADKIFHAWHDRQLRRRLVANGFKRIKDFAWARCARETLAVYRESLELRVES